jgi:hypothetical protein
MFRLRTSGSGVKESNTTVLPVLMASCMSSSFWPMSCTKSRWLTMPSGMVMMHWEEAHYDYFYYHH